MTPLKRTDLLNYLIVIGYQNLPLKGQQNGNHQINY